MGHQKVQSNKLMTRTLLIMLMSPLIASLRLECPKNVDNQCFYASKLALSLFEANRFCLDEGNITKERIGIFNI